MQDKRTLGARFNNWATGFFKIVTPIAIVTTAFWLGQISKEAKLLMFESVEQREAIIGKFKRLPSDAILDRLTEHVTDPEIISKETKDSLYVSKKDFLELVGNNAIDIYNVKKNMDKLLEGQQENKRTLKAMSFKLDKLKNETK